MDTYLIDTHILLWWLSDDKKLKSGPRKIISDSSNRLCVSIASLWECSIRQSLGKLKLPKDFRQIVKEEGFSVISIQAEDLDELDALPQHHSDPFDRMLIAQAKRNGLVLVSGDKAFRLYEVLLVGNTSSLKS